MDFHPPRFSIFTPSFDALTFPLSRYFWQHLQPRILQLLQPTISDPPYPREQRQIKQLNKKWAGSSFQKNLPTQLRQLADT